MTHDLLTQLAEYGSYCEERQGTLLVDDVTDAVMLVPMPTQPTRRRHRWLIAVAAAVVVLVLVGGLTLLEPFEGESVAPTDEPATTTAPTPTTAPIATPATTPATTSQSTTTVVSETTNVSRAPSLLEDALAQGSVTSWYGREVKAALVYIDTYLEGMSGSPIPPEPRFDTTTLGIESVLIEIDRSVLSSLGSYADNDREPIVEHPILAGAQLAGTSHAAAYRIDIGFDDDVVTPKWSLIYTPSYSPGSALQPWGYWANDSFEDNPAANIILVFTSGQDPVVIGGLPADASVVVTTFADGTNVWQRPVAGIAMLHDPERKCIDANSRLTCEGEFRVLDADGNEIFTIVLTPHIQDDTMLDLGFRIDGP